MYLARYQVINVFTIAEFAGKRTGIAEGGASQTLFCLHISQNMGSCIGYETESPFIEQTSQRFACF